MAEFWRVAEDMCLDNPTWRRGQAEFNALLSIRPDLAEAVRGTYADPFYDDDRIQAFREWLYVRWLDEQGVAMDAVIGREPGRDGR